MLKDKNISLYVTGGIASYKSLSLVRELIKKGAKVRVAMTEAATEFINPLTFQVLSQHKVYLDTFDEEDPASVSHIELADWTDFALVVPATANTIAKLANGIADNFVCSALLATKAPLLVAPAMNNKMYDHPSTQSNLNHLKSYGALVLEPATGFLAEGYQGKGRLPEIDTIVQALEGLVLDHQPDLPLSTLKVIVSAGGTRERIDAVRYISNDSSGKMGHEIAQALLELGAQVTLVTTSQLPTHPSIKRIQVESAKEMYQEIHHHFIGIDLLVMAAAVSDYRVKNQVSEKMKKKSDWSIDLVQNPDILKSLTALPEREGKIIVGFAAETNDLETYAKNKLNDKKLDMIIGNQVGKDDRGFNVDQNEVLVLTKDNKKIKIPLTSKKRIAQKIVRFLIKQYFEEQ